MSAEIPRREVCMNRIMGMLILALALAMAAGSLAGASAAPLTGGLTQAGAGSMVVRVDDRYCHELRLACEHKEELGEEGRGNCRRYRETCGGESDYCAQLRYDCLHKEELDEEGHGNCRRYRETCRDE